MKCSCLIVESKKNGKRIVGSGTPADPYLVESNNIICLKHPDGSIITETGAEAYKLPKAIKNINYGGDDYFPNGDTLIWDTPLTNFDLSEYPRASADERKIEIIEQIPNSIELKGHYSAIYNDPLGRESHGSYSLLPAQNYQENAIWTTSRFGRSFQIVTPLQASISVPAVGSTVNPFQLLGDGHVLGITTKRAMEILYEFSFQIDDIGTGFGAPATVVGQNLTFDCYLGLSKTPNSQETHSTALYQGKDYLLGRRIYTLKSERNSNIRVFTFMKKVSLEKGIDYFVYPGMSTIENTITGRSLAIKILFSRMTNLE